MKNQKRGTVIVLVMITMFVLLGFAALVIDVGVMYNTRADLQRTADAAALAGVSLYTSDDMMRVRLNGEPISQVMAEATNRAMTTGQLNPVFDANTLSINRGDVILGWIDITSSTADIVPNPNPTEYNAVKVVARRDSEANGPVEFYFASIFGKHNTNITASAVAALDDRFAGVSSPSQGSATLLPFTIHEDAFAIELADGGDRYSYESGNVYDGSDGIKEVRLFPYPLSGPVDDGGGSFGFLNIGNESHSASVEREQILNGITSEQIVSEFRTRDLIFYDEAGEPITYETNGSPGLEATMENTIETRIGDIVGFFLHDNYVENGANITYTITQIRYGIVMDVDLTGNLDSKFLYVQPAVYVGDDIIIDENTPSCNGMIGRVVLVR